MLNDNLKIKHSLWVPQKVFLVKIKACYHPGNSFDFFLTKNLFIFCVFANSHSFGRKFANHSPLLYLPINQCVVNFVGDFRLAFHHLLGQKHCVKGVICMLFTG